MSRRAIDDDNFHVILFMVAMAFLLFAAMQPGCDVGAELNKPVPMWLWLIT